MEQTEKDQDELGYHPDTIEEPAEGVDKVFCFLDDTRTCGGGCMAYTTRPKMPQVMELTKVQMHCSLIANMDRLGRNISVIGSALAAIVRGHKAGEADKKRKEQFDPSLSPQPQSPFPGSKL